MNITGTDETSGYVKKGREREYMREYQRKRRAAGNRSSDLAHNKKVMARRDAIKDEAIRIKGGKCLICLGSFHRSALDFHHASQDKKSGELARMMTNAKSIEDIMPELDKCILLCANCHRTLLAGAIGAD